MEQRSEGFYTADLYRLTGTLTLQSKTSPGQVSDKSQASQNQSEDPTSQILNPKSQAEAEACLLEAIEIARRQTTKLFALRATMDLCRLWRRQGEATQARQTASEIYSWFTKSFIRRIRKRQENCERS